ncbi:DMT family transporter [Haloarculaceae archaeon H-GB2-1]|nr:DMT family transporter [Haloarculaceae archaeon H-GB1-1]MEA5409017.1 DMT family transporter [Haloarculaceae archaeon H-GB2-1]
MNTSQGETERASQLVSPQAGLGVAILAVSTSAILVRWSQAPAVVQALYRVLFTTLLLAPAAVVRHTDTFRRLSSRDLAWLAVPGVLLAAHFTLWFESLDWTSVAASVTLVQAQPLFVAAGATVLLDERFSRIQAIGTAVALGGAVVMSVGDFIGGTAVGTRPLYGNTLALAAAIALAGYVLAGRSFRQRLPLLPYVTVVYGVCSVALLGTAVASGVALGGYPRSEWLLFLAMAVGPGILGHTLINWSLAHITSSVVSVTLLAEPIGSALLALVLLSEAPGPWTVVGGVVVLAGIYVTSR